MTLKERYDSLPKEVKVLPYLIVAAVLTTVIDQLKLVKLNDTITMAIVNLIVIFLVQIKSRVESYRK